MQKIYSRTINNWNLLYPELKNIDFEFEQLQQISHDFCNEIHSVISEGDGKLLMLDSLLQDDHNSARPGKLLAVDIGGSSLKIASFVYDNAVENYQISEQIRIKEEPFGRIHFSEFIEIVKKQLQVYLKENKLRAGDFSAIAITFSFAADPQRNGEHLDVDRSHMSDDWGKEIEIANSQTNITAALREKLAAEGIVFENWVAINDVTALLMAAEPAQVGCVVGTGFNIGVIVEGKYYNTEAGLFEHPLINKYAGVAAEDIFRRIHQQDKSLPEDDLLNEILISGRYLYQLFLEAASILSIEISDKYKQLIYEKGTEALSIIMQDQTVEATTAALVKHIIIRSQDLVAAQLAGALLATGLEANKESLSIGITGSLILKLPGYKEAVASQISNIIGKQVDLLEIENATLTGAAHSILHL